jgi:hypothetical protein
MISARLRGWIYIDEASAYISSQPVLSQGKIRKLQDKIEIVPGETGRNGWAIDRRALLNALAENCPSVPVGMIGSGN